MSLSTQQVEEFWADGYTVVPAVFDASEIDALRVVAESGSVQQSRFAQDGHSRTVHDYGIAAREPAYWDLAADDRVTSAVSQLIGPNVELHHSKLAHTPPVAGGGGVKWHQDFAFLPHTNSKVLAAFVFLDDADEQNGCVNFLRGSHRAGLLDHRDESGRFAATVRDAESLERAFPRQAMAARAGDMSIHHALTVHGSKANLSGRNRRGLIFQYRSASAVQLGGAIFPDTGRLVAGVRDGKVECEAVTYSLPLNRWPGDVRPTFGSADRLRGPSLDRPNSVGA